MKKLRSIVILCALVLSLTLCTLLTACSSSSSTMPAAPPASSSAAYSMQLSPMGEGNDMASNMVQDAAVAEAGGFTGNTKNAPDTGGGNAAQPAAPATAQPRKLVKDANVHLETKEFDTALQALLDLFEQMGGYVESQSVDGMSLRSHGDYYERNAYIFARIPADKLDAVTQQIGTLCNITSHSESVSDITENYYDVQSRLDMLKVKETRLMELLAKAEKLEDIIKLEDALSTCQYELDSLTGQLRRMDSNVAYSTMQINLSEVVEYSPVQAQPKTFGERLSDSLGRSWRNLSATVQNTILGIVEAGPVLVFQLLLWGVIIYLVYRVVLRKKLRARKSAKQTGSSIADPAPPPAQDDDNHPSAE